MPYTLAPMTPLTEEAESHVRVFLHTLNALQAAEGFHIPDVRRPLEQQYEQTEVRQTTESLLMDEWTSRVFEFMDAVQEAFARAEDQKELPFYDVDIALGEVDSEDELPDLDALSDSDDNGSDLIFFGEPMLDFGGPFDVVHLDEIRGLSEEEFARLRTRTCTQADSTEVCAICLETFEEGDGELLDLACKHCFHVHCGSQWLTSRRTCPSCRQDAYPRE